MRISGDRRGPERLIWLKENYHEMDGLLSKIVGTFKDSWLTLITCAI